MERVKSSVTEWWRNKMVGFGRGYVRPYRRVAQYAPTLRSVSPLGLSEDVLRDFFNLAEPMLNQRTMSQRTTSNSQTENFFVNVTDGDSAYTLAVQLPGQKKEDVEIALEEGVLRITVKSEEEGEILPSEESTSERVLLKEWAPKMGTRSFTLPKDADPEKVGAIMSDGILTLTIGKLEEQQAKRVEIH